MPGNEIRITDYAPDPPAQMFEPRGGSIFRDHDETDGTPIPEGFQAYQNGFLIHIRNYDREKPVPFLDQPEVPTSQPREPQYLREWGDN